MIILLTSCASRIALDYFNKIVEITHAVIVLGRTIHEISNIDRIETTPGHKCVIPIVLDYIKDQHTTQQLFSVLPPPDHIVQVGNEDDNNNLLNDFLEKELKTFGKQNVSSPKELVMKVKQAGINRVIFSVNPATTSSDSDLKTKLHRFVRTGSFRCPKPKTEPITEDKRDMLSKLSALTKGLHGQYFDQLFLIEQEYNQKIKSIDKAQSARLHKSEESEDVVVKYNKVRKLEKEEGAKKILKDQQEEIYSKLVEEQLKALLEFKRNHKSYKS